ncbi:Multiple antibiotic resistance protein marR [Cedecea lapagei]|uniref:HTH-type transcriptional regulator MgrA n=1 Tax=Cedecea lapagei TaxID=158823 RepID=A0A3S4KW22_9ENTR|nr:MarR family transcriptional regulator [Cedecea lapagei]VEC00339.1 Multiple antibiotic resistance protein marR [Cedecea lapagei]
MSNSTDISPFPLHLGLLIHLSNQFKDQLIGQYFAPIGITGPQFKVLISIYKGFNSPVEVSKNLVMDTGAMSRMLERMVKRDLIVRHVNPEDKRQVILALTEKGQQICESFQNEALDSIIGMLTERLTPEESQQLNDLLLKMLPDEITERHL